MSFKTKKYSPLDGIRNKVDGTRELNERFSELATIRGRNGSVASFDSVQTTGRLLDKLDLSAEDEMLLQQALKEQELSRKESEIFQQKRVVCMPASGFPSLRKTSASSSHSNISDFHPLMNIINELPEKDKIKFAKRSEVELHRPKCRYSYLVEEESDNNEEFDMDRNLCSDGYAVDIEKFRLKNSSSESRLGYSSEGAEEQMPTIASLHRPGLKTKSLSTTQTPIGSFSSSETRCLIKPNTQSSIESDASKGNAKESPPVWKFSTPTKSTSNISITKEPQSPALSFEGTHIKSHKKKPSFSLKNLFKSPRIDGETSPGKTKTPSNEPSPSAMKLKFPPLNLHDVNSQNYQKNAPVSASSDNPQTLSRSRGFFPHHSRASSDTKVHYALGQHIRGTKKMARPNDLHSKPLPDPQQIGAKPQKLGPISDDRQIALKQQKPTAPNDDKKMSPDARIRAAIDLRSRGLLRESAEHLKALCDAGNPTGYLLYGLALRYGSGVEKNYAESFKFLKLAANIQHEQLQLFDIDLDPFELNDVPHMPPEPLAPALHECAISYLKGYGVEAVDEVKGLKYLEMAASKGHVDSMCLSGTIWSKSSKIRRKDKARAAAWFRLADRRGADLIGADWIYKDKYQRPHTKSF